MKISVVCPTNRKTISSYARVCELLSLDPNKFEVIIRDNSECEKKSRFLASLSFKYHKILIVPNNGSTENFSEASKLASGDYLLFIADDDWFFKSGLEMLHQLAINSKENKSITALTGAYLVSSSHGIGSMFYSGLDSPDPISRMKGYLNVGPNLLYYSAYKKNVFHLSWNLLEKLPYAFCHADLLFVIPSLVIGSIASVKTLCYQWDFGEWEGADKAMLKRAGICQAAGLPKEFSVLDKLLTAVEGALLINSKLLGNYVRYDRSEVAKLWLQNFFAQYQGCPFQNYFPDSEDKNRVKKFRERLFSIGDISLLGLLEEISNLFREVDPAGAERYYNFWSKL
jgi:hypothetical protein